MAEIIFKNKEDAMLFFQHLLAQLSIPLENPSILLMEDQHTIRILEKQTSVSFWNKVKEAFCEFIRKVKRDDWLKNILTEKYFFQDMEEQQQIMEILYSVLDGEREDLKAFINKANQEPDIRVAVDQIFQDTHSFSFDSFIKFRLRLYLCSLENYLKIAIDEYKMEQDYQVFVHTLREFLSGKEPMLETLHILLDEEITFYNETLDEIKRSELIKMIDRKLLFNHPVYVDSASIAPLLSIAPTTIFLYTKNPEEALVRTIKNIFEERVSIRSFQTFYDCMK